MTSRKIHGLVGLTLLCTSPAWAAEWSIPTTEAARGSFTVSALGQAKVPDTTTSTISATGEIALLPAPIGVGGQDSTSLEQFIRTAYTQVPQALGVFDVRPVTLDHEYGAIMEYGTGCEAPLSTDETARLMDAERILFRRSNKFTPPIIGEWSELYKIHRSYRTSYYTLDDKLKAAQASGSNDKYIKILEQIHSIKAKWIDTGLRDKVDNAFQDFTYLRQKRDHLAWRGAAAQFRLSRGLYAQDIAFLRQSVVANAYDMNPLLDKALTLPVVGGGASQFVIRVVPIVRSWMRNSVLADGCWHWQLGLPPSIPHVMSDGIGIEAIGTPAKIRQGTFNANSVGLVLARPASDFDSLSPTFSPKIVGLLMLNNPMQPK